MSRLLYVITSSAWGGAERYVARLANAAAGEFDVTVAAGGSGSALFAALAPSVRGARLHHLVRPIRPWSDLAAVIELRALIDREGFDLVHANSSKAGLIAALACRLSRKKPKLLYTAHGWGFLEARSALFRCVVRRCEKIAARFRDATIVLSEAERAVALHENLSAPERLHRVSLGIDPDELRFLDRDAARIELEGACGRRLPRNVIGTIANPYPSKNLPLLLRAFDEAADALPETDLVVIGDGPEMPAVRAARAALSHRDRIHLPGLVPDAAPLLRAFDVFTLSSSKEGLPWTVLEASLAGIPIVTTRVGALPELISDGETGLLVKPGDGRALTDAFIRLLAHDRVLYLKLAAGAPNIARARTAAKMLEETFRIYRNALT